MTSHGVTKPICVEIFAVTRSVLESSPELVHVRELRRTKESGLSELVADRAAMGTVAREVFPCETSRCIHSPHQQLAMMRSRWSLWIRPTFPLRELADGGDSEIHSAAS